MKKACFFVFFVFLFIVSGKLSAQCKVWTSVRYQNVAVEKWYVSFHKACNKEIRLTWYVIFMDGTRSQKTTITFYRSSLDIEYPWGFYKPIKEVVFDAVERVDDDEQTERQSHLEDFSDKVVNSFTEMLHVPGEEAYVGFVAGCGNTTIGFPGIRLMSRLGENISSYGISASIGYNPALRKHGGSGLGWSVGMQLYFNDLFISWDWSQSSFYPDGFTNYYKDYTKGLSLSLGYNYIAHLRKGTGLGFTADVGFKMCPGSSEAYFVWNVGVIWAIFY